MSIAKPFTFVANTYAKASEVNTNFDVVYGQVNTNISAIANNATDIDNLENNKANINGSSIQRFSVADPTASTDAVNKQSMMKAIGNSIDYISGLIITKDSGSPNDTIIVSSGSCYDSTKSIVLSLSDATSKQNDNQGASTTYYVYIIGDSTGATIDIIISNNSTTPTLPSGYSLYRLIGGYTTDSNGNILHVYGPTDYRFDGQWVNANVTLSSATSPSIYTIDVSSYLPDDGYNYDLLVESYMSSDGHATNVLLSSSIINHNVQIGHTEGSSDSSQNTFIFPIGTNRKLTYIIDGQSIESSGKLILHGYRRIGTNG